MRKNADGEQGEEGRAGPVGPVAMRRYVRVDLDRGGESEREPSMQPVRPEAEAPRGVEMKDSEVRKFFADIERQIVERARARDLAYRRLCRWTLAATIFTSAFVGLALYGSYCR